MSDGDQPENAPLPNHLIGLPDKQWAVWRQVLLRSAGFPSEMVLCLAIPGWAEAADQLIAAEEDSRAAASAALAALDQTLDELRSNGGWDDAERRKPALKTYWAFKSDRLPKALRLADALEGDSVKEAIARALSTRETLAEGLTEIEETYGICLARQTEEIRRRVSTAAFREAVIWQNRAGFETGINKLAQTSSTARNSQRRQHEELAARYLQRYCVKNDTIGFFGPSAWGRFVDRGPNLDLQPGPRLLKRREVCLEAWGIQELARCLAEREATKEWLPPRCLPYVRIHGDKLHLPKGTVIDLAPQVTLLVKACDGKTPARSIADRLIQEASSSFSSRQEIYAKLRELTDSRILTWGFEVPTSPQAYTALSQQILAIGDPRLRDDLLADLDRLEDCRRQIASAQGDAELLNQAIGRLEATFTRLTGRAPTREAGKFDVSRTLVFEDCLRDVKLDLGPEVLDAVGQPLALLLRGARWLIHRIAQQTRELFADCYRDLVREGGSGAVEVIDFWGRVEPLLFGGSSRVLDAVAPELHRKWREILAVKPGQRRLRFTSAELRQSVSETFETPALGWPAARHHSPDVMISADSQEALARGEFELVLGEIHIGRNTWNNAVFMALHPDREAVFRGLDSDMPQPRVLLPPPRDTPQIGTTRTTLTYSSEKDFLVLPLDGSMSGDPPRALALAELVIEAEGHDLFIRTRDGSLRFDPIDFFGELLSVRCMHAFDLAAESEHRPRITIDRMVVQREAWRFAAQELPFAIGSRPVDRQLAVRRWARTHDIPRFFFTRTPLEKKPFFVDLNSPIFVELFVKAVCRAQAAQVANPRVWVTEMLPRPTQTWLSDAEGQTYTSELRILITDRSHHFRDRSARGDTVHGDTVRGDNVRGDTETPQTATP